MLVVEKQSFSSPLSDSKSFSTEALFKGERRSARERRLRDPKRKFPKGFSSLFRCLPRRFNWSFWQLNPSPDLDARIFGQRFSGNLGKPVETSSFQNWFQLKNIKLSKQLAHILISKVFSKCLKDYFVDFLFDCLTFLFIFPLQDRSFQGYLKKKLGKRGRRERKERVILQPAIKVSFERPKMICKQPLLFVHLSIYHRWVLWYQVKKR